VFSKIMSKVLVDERVLGGCGEEVLFLVFTILGLVGGDVGKDVKTKDGSRGDGSTGDDIGRAVRGVEKGKVLDVVNVGPDRSGRWGILKLGGLTDNGLEDAGGNVKGAWIVPSIVRALEDLEDGGGGVRNVLLVDVIKGRPEGDRDVGEGGGGNDGGLRRREGHSILSELHYRDCSNVKTYYCLWAAGSDVNVFVVEVTDPKNDLR